ncbi:MULTISPECIES: PorP/SprF family type IX secretion system membrane protein [unclassified Carboxylicivirga]|uniref:PorP/SprF family type IX secretion system membrane protein n=1 Tax=Carboxylicivirga TaxID=1628153 RepID=UPI003D32A2CB
MARRIVFFLLLCVASQAWGQQYPQFSQNMFNQLTVNPGYAGANEMVNLTLGNRQQWMGGFKANDGSSMAPSTTVFGADTEVNLLGWESGVGLSLMNDEIGAFTTLYMSAIYAKRWETDYGKLGVGLSFGLINQSINGGILSTMPGGGDLMGVDWDKEEGPFPDDAGTAFDMGLGAFLEHKDYYLGISVAHLNRPKPKFKETYTIYLDRTVFITGGYHIPLKKPPIVLIPSVFLKTNMSSVQVDFNINGVLKDKYWGGLTYRLQDAIVLLGGVELNNGLRIGYSYDVSVSRLNDAKSGSHEIMLGYRFDLSLEKRKKQYKSVRYL